MNRYPTLLVLLLILAGCRPDREKSIAKITSLEQELMKSGTGMFDREKAAALVAAYEEFAGSWPGDTTTANYLFKAAELQMNTDSPSAALATLEKLMAGYPAYRRIPESMFLKGFIYENNLKDLNKARSAYLEFLRRFPGHHFADDAQVLLNNLGKSPEELIREFEQAQTADTVRSGTGNP